MPRQPRRISRRKSRKSFTRGAKSNRRNTPRTIKRGGNRL